MNEEIKRNIAITGLTRINSPKPNKNGATILAFFNCQVGPFELTGCCFVRTSRNGLAVWPPKMDLLEGYGRGIRIADSSTLHALLIAVQEAYRLMGGTDGEWIQRSPEDYEADVDRRRSNFEAAANRIATSQSTHDAQTVSEDDGLKRFLAAS